MGHKSIDLDSFESIAIAEAGAFRLCTREIAGFAIDDKLFTPDNIFAHTNTHA